MSCHTIQAYLPPPWQLTTLVGSADIAVRAGDTSWGAATRRDHLDAKRARSPGLSGSLLQRSTAVSPGMTIGLALLQFWPL
jgi:hypothetical protein